MSLRHAKILVIAAVFTVIGSGTAHAVNYGRIIESAEPLANSYLVQLKDSSTISAKQFTDTYGGEIRETYTAAMHGFTARMSADQARRLAADPRVGAVYEDSKTHVLQQNATWGLDRIDQHSATLDHSYVPEETGEGVTAYDIDTGLTIGHPDFGGRASIGKDFVRDSAADHDCVGHGTHTAGTIGSTTWGVAKKAKIVSVKVIGCSGSGSTSNVYNGIEWVIKNAHKPAVINISLSTGTQNVLTRAIDNATAAGIPVVVAAGNGNEDACQSHPANVASAITVGATEENDGRAGYSNYGRCVDLFAPGNDIESTSNQGSGSGLMSGTSSSAPHVTGAVALYLQRHPVATPQEVASALTDSATAGAIADAGPDSANKLLYVRRRPE